MGEGFLSRLDLLCGMRHVRHDISGQELDEILASLDSTDRASDKKQIGYREFISALVERQGTFSRVQLWECFKKFDVDGNGLISYEDVQKTMIGVTKSEWISIVGVKNGDGAALLSFDAFVALMYSPNTGVQDP